MAVKIKFNLIKTDDEVYLVKYQIADSNEWNLVSSQFRLISNHPCLTSKESVSNIINSMTHHRTFLVRLSDEESAPYLNGEFTDNVSEIEEVEDEAVQGSVLSDNSVLDKMNELMKIQQEMFSVVLKSFKETHSSSSSQRRQKLEISRFDGKEEDAKSWLITYEKLCLHNDWVDDSTKINGLRANLEGNALKWFTSMVRDEVEEDWELWKSSFLSSFGQNRIAAAIAADRWEYRGGSLMDYYYEKQRLIQIAYPSIDDNSFITRIMMGLPEQMQNQILAKDPQTKKELRASLEQLKPLKMQKVVNPSTQKGKKDSSHTHDASNKPKDSFISLEETSENPLPHEIPHAKCKANVYGTDYSCRLDTGADKNLVSSELVKNKNWQLIDKKFKLRSFTNETIEIKKVCYLPITVYGQSASLEFCVVDNLPYCFLVSEKGLHCLGISLTKKNENVSLALNSDLEKISQDSKPEVEIERLFPTVCVNELPCPSFVVDFKLKENHEIVQEKYFRLSYERLQWVSRKVDDLIARKIISPSESEYASPITLAKKENGELRLCVDYRKINKQTTLDPYPFQLIDDIIHKFGGCKFFSKIDLKESFWQIGLSSETRKFTAFVTPFGQYEWNRLPFGWKNSPAIFQRRMNEIFGQPHANPMVAVYIDDILIGGRTELECSQNTLDVLKKLENAKMIINLNKSEFNKDKVKFLGRIIDGNTKSTKEESIEKVRNMSRPNDLRSIRQFTGLTGHFRAFIKNYAEIVRPLDSLKQKDKPFEWTNECENAFIELKRIITDNPILQLPDLSLNYELCTDASGLGTGSILYQRDKSKPKNQQLRVIGYQSYTFTKAEINYPITEKEGLAVIKAIKYFRSYLEGKPFIVHTDHSALKYLIDINEPTGRLARWQNFLNSFEITINHRPGRLLSDADAISRLCLGSTNDILMIQEKHKNEKVKEDQTPCIYPMSNKNLTSEQIKRILKLYHDDRVSGGHDGFWRTYFKIKSRFYWLGMKKQIQEYVQSCHICQTLKPKTCYDIPFCPPHSDVPFDTIHIDFGELQKRSESIKTTQSFLLIIDEATRIIAGKAMTESSESVIRFLNDFSHIASVKTIVSDNGTAFTSERFRKWAENRNINLKNSSPYHPASNGLIERKMRDVKQFIKIYRGSGGNWKELLDSAIRHSNRSYNSIIGCTPYFKLYGKSSSLPADKLFDIDENSIKETPFSKEKIEELRKPKIKTKIQQKLAIGDKIMVKTGIKGKQRITKGPFTIIDLKSYDGIIKTIIYKNDRDEKAIAHVSNCYRYHDRSHEL